MNILYIGSGFVGTCSAAVSADSGHTVLVYDIDKKKIAALGSHDRDTIEKCLHEKGLGDLLVRSKDRITFTHDYVDVIEFLEDTQAIFMCLPTPEIGETGESDLTYYRNAAETLAKALAKRNGGEQSEYIVIVNKSTVPITMVDQTQEILDAHGVKNVGVVSNPEFLVEGKAVEGSLKPNRVVVGAWEEKDFAVMRNVYERFLQATDVPYFEVNPKEAAAGKLLANYYLFNRLAVCFDVIGRTCESFDDVSFEQLRKIMTSDERIGTWGFYDSLYAGGSCFIKDARSLSHQLQTAGANTSMVQETYLANKRQLKHFLSRTRAEAGVDWSGNRVGVLGLAFKRDTNDTRNSPSIDIVQTLLEENVAELKLYDPVASDMFQAQFPASEQITYTSNEREAIADVDVVIISTDWPQFQRVADMLLQRTGEKRPLIMDGRRSLSHKYIELHDAGYTILPVGGRYLS